MKRLFCLLIAVCAILCGCGKDPGKGQETAPRETRPAETQPAVSAVPETEPRPTLLEQAQVWDEAGLVQQLPLEILEEEPFFQMELLDDELLIWEMIYDNEWICGIRLRIVELDHGHVAAERTLEIQQWLDPQIQGDRICICDSATGQVTTLDHRLEIRESWQTEPDWNRWLLGDGSTLYIVTDSQILARDLDTGEERTILDRAAGVYVSDTTPDGLWIWYTDVDLCRQSPGYLDLETETLEQPPFRGIFSVGEKAGGVWLCRSYLDGCDYRLGDGAQAWDIELEGGLLHLTPEGHLLEEHVDGNHLYLYDLEGKILSCASYSRDGRYVSGGTPVWSEKLGGYLFLVNDLDYTRTELLLWDPEVSGEGTDLTLTPVDLTLTEEDELDQLRQRAEELGNDHGVKIWIGTDCQTEFDDFTADLLTSPELVEQQLDILEQVLDDYPRGFFYQLRYENHQQIHIQLVSNLMAKPHYGTGDSYGGFVQPVNGYDLMVINTDYAAEGTYYHEFSHIIDSYLEWNSWQREDALYSEEGWTSRNPEGFEYTWDYAVMQDFSDDWDEYFIDQYAMINSTEDRARIMEYGMLEYMDWRFEEMPGAVEKLRYYAMCIRDAFDTTGWPETVLWEQYL